MHKKLLFLKKKIPLFCFQRLEVKLEVGTSLLGVKVVHQSIASELMKDFTTSFHVSTPMFIMSHSFMLSYTNPKKSHCISEFFLLKYELQLSFMLNHSWLGLCVKFDYFQNDCFGCVGATLLVYENRQQKFCID